MNEQTVNMLAMIPDSAICDLESVNTCRKNEHLAYYQPPYLPGLYLPAT